MSLLSGQLQFAALGRLPSWKLLTFLIGLALAAPVHALSPREELLRLVPPNSGFCLVVQDLRVSAAAIAHSPFVEHLRESPFGKMAANLPEAQKIKDAEQNLKEFLDLDWATLRDEILGDAIVMAYRPGPPGHQEQEQGLLLIRARDPDLLTKLIDRVNAVQKQSNDLTELETRHYHGIDYMRRVERRGTNYYYVHGSVFAYTSREEVLRQVIDLESQAPDNSDPLITRQLRRLGADKAILALWINPKAFDAEIEQKTAVSRGAEAAIRKAFVSYWKGLEGIALFLALGSSDAEVGVSFLAQSDQLASPLRELFAGKARPSQFWNQVPENAMIAVAGHVDAVGLADFLGKLMPPDARKNLRDTANRWAGAPLGKEVVQDVLPWIGPDWGFYVSAPTASQKGWFPRAILALAVQPGDKNPPVDQSILNALNSLALLAVFAYNNNHSDILSLKTVSQGKTEVRYFTNDKVFAPGLRPGFALKDGYLVLASSPEAVRQFSVIPGAVQKHDRDGETPVLRLSLREVRTYLTNQRQVLASETSAREGVTRDQAERRLNIIVAALEPLDRIELVQRSAAAQFAIVARLRTVHPLRK